MDERTGQADAMGIDLTGLDNLIGLDDGDLRAFGEARVEVLGAAAKLAVAERVGAVGGYQRVVDVDRGFKDKRLAVEKAHLLVSAIGVPTPVGV